MILKLQLLRLEALRVIANNILRRDKIVRFFHPMVKSTISHQFSAAFGSENATNDSLKRLKSIEEKLEYKAQALESLKAATKVDPKVLIIVF